MFFKIFGYRVEGDSFGLSHRLPCIFVCVLHVCVLSIHMGIQVYMHAHAWMNSFLFFCLINWRQIA